MDQELTPVPETGFHFRPSDHTYWLDGCLIPGCTTIMQDVGIVDLSRIPADRLARARERGDKIHHCVQWLDEGRLDWRTVDPEFTGYLQAYMSFLDNEHFSAYPEHTEVPIYHKKLLYGVTPDRFGYFTPKARRAWAGQPAIVEIKNTYDNADYWGIQTAAQGMALQSQGVDIDPKTVIRLAVNLKPDGTYKIDMHDDPNDCFYFASCLAVYGLKRKRR